MSVVTFLPDSSENLLWFAFYTRPRHEQQVESRFCQLGMESFLPRIPLRRQWKDRMKIVEWPLFPGYIFGRCEPWALTKAVATSGVVSVVSNNGNPAPVGVHELESVRVLMRALAETGTIPERVPLEPGTAVRVTAGPFEGVQGVVVEQRNGRRFMVQLTTIGEGLVVNVDDRLLEAM